MYKVQSDDALLSLQISLLAGEYEIVTTLFVVFFKTSCFGLVNLVELVNL